MIRRTITLDDGSQHWLLISQVEHARISGANGVFVLTDLGSTNGTLVNDESVQERVLEDGDRITIGETVLEFRRA